MSPTSVTVKPRLHDTTGCHRHRRCYDATRGATCWHHVANAAPVRHSRWLSELSVRFRIETADYMGNGYRHVCLAYIWYLLWSMIGVIMMHINYRPKQNNIKNTNCITRIMTYSWTWTRSERSLCAVNFDRQFFSELLCVSRIEYKHKAHVTVKLQ